MCCKCGEQVAQGVLEVGQITTDSKDLWPKGSSLVPERAKVKFMISGKPAWAVKIAGNEQLLKLSIGEKFFLKDTD